MERVHATSVAIEGTAALIRGPSGSGKSDLALRLIDAGACLVADDYTELEIHDGRVVARAPSAISGLLEVRGLGVIRVECLERAPVGLVVDLVERDKVERLPDPGTSEEYGIVLPLIRLYAFEASAPAKLRLALARSENVRDWNRE